MKTIVDCERNPKPAFFAYQDALTPLAINVRNDRKTYFAGEDASIELFICNDTQIQADGHQIICELLSKDGSVVYSGTFPANFKENSSFMQGDISFKAPDVSARTAYTLRAILTDAKGEVIHYYDEEIEVFPTEAPVIPKAIVVTGEEFTESAEKLTSLAELGNTVIINNLTPGIYTIAGSEVKVKSCGMRALHFVSRKTGHDLVKDFGPYDFKHWYSEEDDMITPLIRYTFTAENAKPILTSGNSLRGSAWGQKLYPALACAELSVGKGKIIINEVNLDSHLSNPVALKFKNKLVTY
jgi:hypothetical protein